jgi:hypothetical protein
LLSFALLLHLAIDSPLLRCFSSFVIFLHAVKFVICCCDVLTSPSDLAKTATAASSAGSTATSHSQPSSSSSSALVVPASFYSKALPGASGIVVGGKNGGKNGKNVNALASGPTFNASSAVESNSSSGNASGAGNAPKHTIQIIAPEERRTDRTQLTTLCEKFMTAVDPQSTTLCWKKSTYYSYVKP